MGIELAYENLIKRVLAKAKSVQTKKGILEFDRELKLDGRKLITRRNYLQRINLLLEWWKKPIEEMTREDSLNFIEYMKDRGMTPASVEVHKYAMNVIQTYVFGREPEWLRDIKRNKKNRMFKVKRPKITIKKDVLTSEDIKKMVELAKSVRDKAIIMSLWESGTRIECEFLQICIRDVTFDQYGCLAVVGDPQESKTGQRTLRLIDSSDFLRAWIKEHPNPRPENYLWVSGRDREWLNPDTAKKEVIPNGKNLTNQAVTRLVKGLGKRIGKSNISPHDFRRGRATELAQELTSFELCSFMGWEMNSAMPRVYINRSNINTDRKLLANRGLISGNGNGNGNRLETRLCPKCGKPNLITSRFCYGCGSYLEGHEKKTEKQAFAENFMEFVTSQKDSQEFFERMMERFVGERGDRVKNI